VSPRANSPQSSMDAYLAELRTRLRALPEEQITDIVEEIRSHIRDSAGASGAMTDAGIHAALSRLGPPSALAANYVTDNLLAGAQRTRLPWKILRGIYHWATLSVKGVLVFITCVFGYGFGSSFFIAALVKPFIPKVGLWMTDSDTFSLVLGLTNAVPRGRELLGWKLIPIGFALGGGTILLTTYFAQSSIRRFRETQARRRLGGTAQ
jgi:uncharacterized membrane protein